MILQPASIPRFLVSKTTTVHFLSFTLSNEPGALRRVLDILAREELNILSISSLPPNPQKGSTLEVVAFVDFNKARIAVEEVAAQIQAQDHLPCKVSKQQFPGLTFDDLHFPVELSGERAIVFREPIYRSLYAGIRAKMGSAGEAFLYHTGTEAGVGLWRNIQDIMEQVSVREEQIPELIRLLEFAHGRSRLQFTEMDIKNRLATLRIFDSFECSAAERMEKPYSALYRGLLAGLFSGWLGPVNATETKCVAVGDPNCEVQIRSL